MPIYEYRCQSCGHTLDALQKLSDAPLQDCPACDAPALKRLISAPAFRLKGSGWYETDFKSDKERKRNLVDGAEKAESGDKAASDAKPDAAAKTDGGAKTEGATASDKSKKPDTKKDSTQSSSTSPSSKSKGGKGSGSEAA